MKALLLGVCALSISMAAVATASAADDLPDIPDLVESPTWLKKDPYNGDTYPKKALEANKSGSAGIICTVKADGKMEKCFVEFEDPEGYDFGKWLLEYSKVLNVKTTDAKGASIVGKKVSYIVDMKPTKK